MKAKELIKADLYVQLLGIISSVGLILVSIVKWDGELFFKCILLQGCFVIYQFITNFCHLFFREVSKEYNIIRKIYFLLQFIICAAIGILEMIRRDLIGEDLNPYFIGVVVLIMLLYSQGIIYTYIYLCKKEVDFIEQNEFHILK